MTMVIEQNHCVIALTDYGTANFVQSRFMRNVGEMYYEKSR